ncbi:MAG TPA: alpha-E domain-containing protein, partial [Polyangiaceae bacterium]|nr:alpha-E domain-containing protein [Polyangiaceae bacterium]
MLSRVADAVYWASRYVERAENVARFVNVNLDLMLDSPSTQKPSWEPLVLTTGDQDWYRENYETATAQSVMQFLTFDRKYPNSILSSVMAARENARTVREVISREMWQEVNGLYLTVVEASRKQGSGEEMAHFYERVKVAGIYYGGVT